MKQVNNQFTVLLAPIISEKSTDLGDRLRTVVFRVDPMATKGQIRDAVEELFEVKVDKVGTVRISGKVKRFKGHLGKRASIKKAYVVLQKGHDINFSELR